MSIVVQKTKKSQEIQECLPQTLISVQVCNPGRPMVEVANLLRLEGHSKTYKDRKSATCRLLLWCLAVADDVSDLDQDTGVQGRNKFQSKVAISNKASLRTRAICTTSSSSSSFLYYYVSQTFSLQCTPRFVDNPRDPARKGIMKEDGSKSCRSCTMLPHTSCRRGFSHRFSHTLALRGN